MLTTSYPRHPGDVAGSFIAAGVEQLREAGVVVDVVSPASFRHFGIAYGDGIVNNLRRSPWRLLLLPAFLVSFTAAARRAARSADVVHAHWLPSALPALATRRPVVLQVWGSDIALAGRVRWAARRLLARVRVVVCASEALATEVRGLGAREVRIVPSGVEIPAATVPSETPPHVLYLGRLSEEKGVRELAQATEGMPLVVVGDGPLRDLLPWTAGFVSPGEVGEWLDRAAVIVVPSRREGYGMAAREAMAHGRAVVATRVGGLVDAIEDGVTGLLVPPHDPDALRAALQRALADPELRDRLGAAAREHALAHFSSQAACDRLVAVYDEVTSDDG